jgi:hypothetical protein
MRFNKVLLSIAAVASLVAGAANATELITNGNFESGDYGQIGYQTNKLAGWTTTGYNFLFNATNDDTTGVQGVSGTVALWGPNKGSNNGLSASPVGGNYVAADGNYGVAPLQQTVNGLAIGQQYQLTFYWAGVQQSNRDGATTEQWKVTFGGDTLATAVLNDPSHGFTGWKQETMNFTAKSTSQVLSFLAVGTPVGDPPFSLLDGVSMNAVPEPGSLALLGLGMGLLSFTARRRKTKPQ